jgi:hypothetical protein
MKKFNIPSETVLEHSPEVLAGALEPSLNAATLHSAQGLIYRHCFIKLFNHLQNIGRLVASGQVAVESLDGLDYWLYRIASYEYPPEGRNPEDIFQPALAKFGYQNIPDLGRMLKVSNWSTYDRRRSAP